MTLSGTEIVGGFFAAFGQGDMDGAMTFLADDIRWTYHGPSDVIPWGGTFTGRGGVLDFFAKFSGAAEPIAMTPKAMVELEGLVYVRGIEHTRIKATGKEYAVEWVHVLSTANGKITSFDEYMDTATVAASFA